MIVPLDKQKLRSVYTVSFISMRLQISPEITSLWEYFVLHDRLCRFLRTKQIAEALPFFAEDDLLT